MSTQPTNPVMGDVLDTFFAYIAQQYQLVNAARVLAGMMAAQDWPQAEIKEGALYLLYLNSVELASAGSRAQTYFEHYLQWAWILIGDDLSAAQVGANRGNRYREDLAIVEELRQVHFPGFCPKQQIAVSAVSGVATLTPYEPIEMVSWTMPRLGRKLANQQSGVLYGTAPVEVYGWSTVNPLVNA